MNQISQDFDIESQVSKLARYRISTIHAKWEFIILISRNNFHDQFSREFESNQLVNLTNSFKYYFIKQHFIKNVFRFPPE